MREIGGYLELDEFVQNEYYKDLVALNSARNAFVYLVRAKDIKKVYLPYYLCDCVSRVCDREEVSYEFYHIDHNFMPIFDKTLVENEYLYLVNYFGQLSGEEIIKYHRQYKNIIVDNVQAFFDKPVDDVDTIYSCRKFFGVPDGAYLSTNAKGLSLPRDISMDRMKHLLGRYEHETASKFYADFQTNDLKFEELELMYMSKVTKNILGAVDYSKVINKRNENWKILENSLSKYNRLKLSVPCAPYMYPFYSEIASNIRNILAAKKIYIPMLWPNVMCFEGCELEKEYANNILLLPCDQRYDAEDMKYIITEVLACIN